MTKPPDADIARCLEEWENALLNGDMKQGLFSAAEGYRLAVSKTDEIHERMFLGFVKFAMEELLKTHAPRLEPGMVERGGTIRCSFCGQPNPERLLVHGVGASICAKCIELANKAVQNQQP
jgi:hypothetical protein